MGEMIIRDGKKHYILHALPKTMVAFRHFVLQKVEERLISRGYRNLNICTDELNKAERYPPRDMQEVYRVIDSVVDDSIYYGF